MLTAGVFVLIGCVFQLLRLFNYAGGPVAVTLAVLAGPCVTGYLLLSSGRPFDFHELYWSCLSAYALVGLAGGAVGFPVFFAARLCQYGPCLGPVARVIAGAMWAAVGVAVLYLIFVAGGLFSAVDTAADTPVSAYVRFARAAGGLAATVSWAAVVAPVVAAVAAAVLFVSVWWSGTGRAPLWVSLAVRFARRGPPEKAVPRLTRLLGSRDDATVGAAAAALGDVGQAATPALTTLLRIGEVEADGTGYGEWSDENHPGVHARVAVVQITRTLIEKPEGLIWWIGSAGVTSVDTPRMVRVLDSLPTPSLNPDTLTRLLSAPSREIVAFAARRLRQIGPPAATALPTLVRRLGEPIGADDEVIAATEAIDPNRRETAGLLAERVQDWKHSKSTYVDVIRRSIPNDAAILASFLQRLPTDRTGDWVLPELFNELRTEERHTLLLATEQLGDGTRLELFRTFLRFRNSELRSHAFTQLSRMGEDGQGVLAAHLGELRRGWEREDYRSSARLLAAVAPTHPTVVAECFAALSKDADAPEPDEFTGGEALAHLLKHQLLTADSVPRLKDALASYRRQPHLLKVIGSLGGVAASLVPDLLKLNADPGEQRRDEIDAAIDRIGPVSGGGRVRVIDDFARALDLDEDDCTCRTAPLFINRDFVLPPERPCGRCVICVYVGYLQRFDRSPQDAIPPLVGRLLLAAKRPTLKINEYELRKALARLGVPTDPAVAESVLRLLAENARQQEAEFARELFADPKASTDEQYERFLLRLAPSRGDDDEGEDEDDDWEFEDEDEWDIRDEDHDEDDDPPASSE